MKIVKLQSHLISEIKKATEVCIASAIVSENGLRTVLDNKDEGCKLKLIIGIDLPTPATVFKKLLELQDENIEARVFLKPYYFHPKLYLTSGKSKVVFVGSGNCTTGGLDNHIELFHKVSDDEVYDEYNAWFNTYFSLSSEITEEWLTEYEKLFEDRQVTENSERKKVSAFKKKITENKEIVDLDSIDFTNQFFKKNHYKAFENHKIKSRLQDHDKERLEVKKRLEELHDLVLPLIENKGWDIHPHHMNSHIVSSHQHGEFTSDDLVALWLHYGRSEEDLSNFKKIYGDNQTSMYQMRLQVLVHLEDISIWLRVGKNNGSVVDRENFKKNIKQASYQDKFYKLIEKLPDSYYIKINDEKRMVRTFTNALELADFVKNDNINRHYFIIGREYLPSSIELSESNIANTIIEEFKFLYPIYELIKTTI
ncbi:phospholipase D family protein [Flavobacterium sp.]|uniref:phospholipase D family protein n=1 Tax=Flavobacterium sp. TaxID=239 RepID=UPI0038D2039B